MRLRVVSNKYNYALFCTMVDTIAGEKVIDSFVLCQGSCQSPT